MMRNIACVAIASVAVVAGSAARGGQTPGGGAVWTMVLAAAAGGRPLTIVLRSDGGKWRRAACTALGYNNAVHDVDASALKVAGRKIQGGVKVTVNPDSWIPRDRKSVACEYEIEAAAGDDGGVSGTYSGRFGRAEVRGKVSGRLDPAGPLPRSATVRLRLERAAAGWAAHTARGALTFAWVDGAAKRATLHSAYPWGWHARVGELKVRLTADSLEGEVRAGLGVRPGGTDIGAQPYTFRLAAAVIGSAVVGTYAAAVAGKDSHRGTLIGTVEAGTAGVEPALGPVPPKAVGVDAMSAKGPVVAPWKSFSPDAPYHGAWLVAGDLDGDGRAEVVTARNAGQAVTAAVATTLDGATLWRWGRAGAGGATLGYDVPLQVYDLDGDGQDEVYIGVRGAVVVLEGKTGRELRRLPLAGGLVPDCITFANLRGLDRPRDLIVKNRHQQLWAYAEDGKSLWTWPARPYPAAHHPTPVDLDGDGKDEIVAGFTLLGHDGKERWTLKSDSLDLAHGHVDSCEVIGRGSRPEDVRLVITGCTANFIGVADGAGGMRWAIPGSHFESVDVGRIRADVPGNQAVVDIDKLPFGQARVWLLDDRGNLLVEWLCRNGRFHRLLDWDGDGLADVLLAADRKLFNGLGRCVAVLGPEGAFAGEPAPTGGEPAPLGLVADVDGDGRGEVILHSLKRVCVYKSDKASKAPPLPLGTRNFTLY